MPSLAYATSGPGLLFNAIGWFNFASAPATIISPASLTLTNDIKGGGTLQATFTFSKNTAGSSNFVKTVPPTWPGAAFGNTAYIGITQPVCMRDTTDAAPNFGRIDVSNIVLKNKYGDLITNYNFYFTDSETPATGETEQFITNGSPWSVFYTLPNSGQGFATLTGVGTQTVAATGLGNTPILLTTNPTGISQTLTGAGAMSFGMSLTTAELVKVVNGGRVDPSDQFQLNISGPNSGTTITTGQQTGVQPQGLQIISGEGGQSVFTFNESMAPGSASSLSFYNPVVQVSNLTSGGTILPSTINLGSALTLNIGDYALVTIVNAPAPTSVTLTKTVDKSYSNIGDILTYTMVVNNNSPYPIRNVVVKDTIPNFTTFVSNSMTVDGTTISGSPAPPSGVTVGTLTAGAMSTITFSVLVQSTIPSPNRVTNNSTVTFDPTISIGSVNSQTVITTINSISITSSKLVNKSYANIGDILTYTIPITNTGNITATNVIFVDTLPNDTTLVPGSFVQNGATISGSPNPPGVLLNNISAGSTLTVVFKVTVNTIPSPNPINNSATTTFNYSIDPTTTTLSTGNTNTNIVSTQVNNASLANISKSVDKLYTTCGEVITYTVTLPNNGNVTAFNVILRDTIPNGTTLIPDTVTINSVTQPLGTNPQSGINIGTIPAGGSSTLKFQVKVNC